MTTARMPGRCRAIPDAQASELDLVIGPDSSRTFAPLIPHRGATALRIVVAIVLIALGCALLIIAGHAPILAIGP